MIKTLTVLISSIVLLVNNNLFAKDIVFIDNNVDGFHALVNTLEQDYTYYFIDSKKDGIKQVVIYWTAIGY